MPNTLVLSYSTSFLFLLGVLSSRCSLSSSLWLVVVVLVLCSSLVPRPRPRRVGIKDINTNTRLLLPTFIVIITSINYSRSPCSSTLLFYLLLMLCSRVLYKKKVVVSVSWDLPHRPSSPAPEGWDKEITHNQHSTTTTSVGIITTTSIN